MKIINNRSILVDYVEPLKKNEYVQYAFAITVEAIKIVAVTCFLSLLAIKFVTPNSHLSRKVIYRIVVESPVVEEIIFRGFFLRGLRLLQEMANWSSNKQTEQFYRVHITALLFGLTHSLPLQAAFAYEGGVGYGYLTEKYETLSVTILAHGINNFIGVKFVTSTSLIQACGYLTAWVAQEIGFQILARYQAKNQKISPILNPSEGG